MKLNINLINIITNYVGFYKDLDFEVPFYEKHIKKINWEYICQNINVPESFYEKYIKKLIGFLYVKIKIFLKLSLQIILIKYIGDLYVLIQIFLKVFLKIMLMR